MSSRLHSKPKLQAGNPPERFNSFAHTNRIATNFVGTNPEILEKR
jgi:hypothetical protein